MVPARHARVAGSRTSRVVLGILATRTRLGDRPTATESARMVLGAYHALRAVSYLSSAEAPRVPTPMPRGDRRRVIG